MAIRVFSTEGGVQLPLISRDARLIVWPGTGAETANMNYVVLEPGEANDVHSHRESEDTIVVLEGAGSVHDVTNDVVHEVRGGQVIHVPVGVVHAVRADRGSRMVSIGGPCPADRHLLRAVGAID